ncbi:MAG: heme exporter protein CcmD [Methylococcaceae bacterium]
MGGYGLYVWTSYGLMAVLLVYNIAAPIQRKRHLMQHLKSFLERDSNKTRLEDRP